MGISEIGASQQFSLSQQFPGSGGTQAQGVNGSAESRAGSNSADGSIDVSNLQLGIDHLNQMLSGSQTKVVFAQDAPPHHIWLNIVDSSGRVIERLPPEGLRQYMETQDAKGMAVNMFL